MIGTKTKQNEKNGGVVGTVKLNPKTATLKEAEAVCLPNNLALIKEIALEGKLEPALHAMNWLDRNGFDVSKIAVNRVDDEVVDCAVAKLLWDEKQLVTVALSAKNVRGPKAALQGMKKNWWYASIAEVREKSTNAETKRIARELIESPTQAEIGLMVNSSRVKDLVALARNAEGDGVAEMAVAGVVRVSQLVPPAEFKDRLGAIRDSAVNSSAREIAARELGKRFPK